METNEHIHISVLRLIYSEKMNAEPMSGLGLVYTERKQMQSDVCLKARLH